MAHHHERRTSQYFHEPGLTRFIFLSISCAAIPETAVRDQRSFFLALVCSSVSLCVLLGVFARSLLLCRSASSLSKPEPQCICDDGCNVTVRRRTNQNPNHWQQVTKETGQNSAKHSTGFDLTTQGSSGLDNTGQFWTWQHRAVLDLTTQGSSGHNGAMRGLERELADRHRSTVIWQNTQRETEEHWLWSRTAVSGIAAQEIERKRNLESNPAHENIRHPLVINKEFCRTYFKPETVGLVYSETFSN